MADSKSPIFDNDAYDYTKLPDYDTTFIAEEDLEAFRQALAAPDLPLDVPQAPTESIFFTALNDWAPLYQRVRRRTNPLGTKKSRKLPPTRKDETREGNVYSLLKWPLLFVVLGWLIVLGAAYMLTRAYIFAYEHFVTIRGHREKLRRKMRSATTYDEWIVAAKEMDKYLGNNKWKEIDQYAYYNSGTIRRVKDELRALRTMLEKEDGTDKKDVAEDLRLLLEASVKDNFVGVENSRLYSETFYGTKNIVQEFVDEVELSLEALSRSKLPLEEKAITYNHLYRNYGRTALCLSGGAAFAYYHFGVCKALLDADVFPEVMTGTSGGSLVAALLATRTNAELKQLLIPALAHKITACSEGITTWFPRWYRTGARFDSVDWARGCSWFCRGSITFREAYERTGRILNVTCIPSDPHSPTVLANYLTAPDCIIWSAVLASAAVPGILNPVVLMKKNRATGKLEPYSFGAKWKDGSLRTDVPLKALNTHFNVNFSIVSQVNPHINLFFFSSRGTVGRPVTHRRGRGWRGGFLGSALEQYLKLDLTKWLKVLRHLELLPRFVGQDWSEIWLQRFSGTVTIWPRVKFPWDFINILADPSPQTLERMIQAGMQSAFPKILFVRNRVRIERMIEKGLRMAVGEKKGAGMGNGNGSGTTFSAFDMLHSVPPTPSEEQEQHDFLPVVNGAQTHSASGKQPSPGLSLTLPSSLRTSTAHRPSSPSLVRRLNRGWWNPPSSSSRPGSSSSPASIRRSSSVLEELSRQTRVLYRDCEDEDEQHEEYDVDTGVPEEDDGEEVGQQRVRGSKADRVDGMGSVVDPLVEMAGVVDGEADDVFRT